MDKHIQLSCEIGEEHQGERLDKTLALLFPDYSRSQLKSWIEDGSATVDGKTLRPRQKISGGETVVIDVELEERENWEAQDIDLDVVFEDDDILVINKPIGLVAHPGIGNTDNTLVNALLHHHADLSCLPRGGLVHRLDKETSGLLVVAKTMAAHKHLIDQLQTRQMGREYVAIACGVLTGGRKIDEPMGRHPTQRTKQAVVHEGKPAITHFRIIERFAEHSYIRINLETGRTHQIRVHMAHILHPLLGDPLYGRRFSLPKKASDELIEALRAFRHQALHARALTLLHPVTNEELTFESPLPADFQNLLRLLREHEVENR